MCVPVCLFLLLLFWKAIFFKGYLKTPNDFLLYFYILRIGDFVTRVLNGVVFIVLLVCTIWNQSDVAGDVFPVTLRQSYYNISHMQREHLDVMFSYRIQINAFKIIIFYRPIVYLNIQNRPGVAIAIISATKLFSATAGYHYTS